MSKTTLLILALLSSLAAGAQDDAAPNQPTSDTINVRGEKMWIGKEIDGDQLKKRIAEGNSMFYGTQHRGYHMLNMNGEEINMETSGEKVCMYATWDATCHYKLDKLNELQKQYKDNKDFQLVVVVFDTTGLEQIIADEKLELRFARVENNMEMNRVNYGNGYPGYIIMAKDNVIRGLGSLHDRDQWMGVLKKVL